MIRIPIFLLASLTFSNSAKAIERRGLEYKLISSEIDAKLPETESIYEFQFSGIEDASFTILYSVDGVTDQAEVTPESRLTLCVKPGKHIFEFYTWGYSEIFTDSIQIKAQHRDIYDVDMLKVTKVQHAMKKPVIYLYPTQPIEVNLSLNIHGTEPFYYPTYADGWQCTAFPNGDLLVGDKTYNYLFWEASMPPLKISHQEGFIVSKSNVVAFLETQLTIAGLSSKEQADFITFWGPQLASHDRTFVHFMFNEQCDQFAELDISPKPDHIYRISMLWQPTEISFEVQEQVMEPINRDGFTVIEWGGMELSPLTKNEAL